MLLSDLRVEGGQLVLTGKGFGHGVGMCQWGAKLMAEQGKAPRILSNFTLMMLQSRNSGSSSASIFGRSIFKCVAIVVFRVFRSV
jgi:hypothetical protein